MERINCDNGGFCDLKTKDNFKFSGNTSGIYVIIDPLLKKDDLMKWTCFYDSTNISYTVKIGKCQCHININIGSMADPGNAPACVTNQFPHTRITRYKCT